MLYFSILCQEQRGYDNIELWFRKNGDIFPIYDYKIEADQIRLISDSDSSIQEAITLDELISYVQEEGSGAIPYTVVDELTGKYLDIKDRFEYKLVFEICN